jgi:hypothetical protein
LVAGAARTIPERLPGHLLPLASVKPRLWFSRAIKHSILQERFLLLFFPKPQKGDAPDPKKTFARSKLPFGRDTNALKGGKYKLSLARLPGWTA